MTDRRLGELAGDVAFLCESLKQCLYVLSSLRPDQRHNFTQQAAEMHKLADKWLAIAEELGAP